MNEAPQGVEVVFVGGKNKALLFGGLGGGGEENLMGWNEGL